MIRFSVRQVLSAFVFEVVLSFAMFPPGSRQTLSYFFGSFEGGECPAFLQS